MTKRIASFFIRRKLVAVFAISMVLLFGCGDSDQDRAEDTENASDTPSSEIPGLLIAGSGGLFWTDGVSTEAIYEDAATVFKRIILLPDNEGLLVIGYEKEWDKGLTLVVDPATLAVERIELPVESLRYTLESVAVDPDENLWLAGGDETNHNGLLLKNEHGKWQRIYIDRGSVVNHWRLTAITFFDGEIQLAGFDENLVDGLFFNVDIKTNTVTEESNSLDSIDDREYMPRRLIVVDTDYDLWMLGSYLDTNNDPMLYLNENDQWSIANSCSLQTHRNYWGGDIDGHIFVTGSICKGIVDPDMPVSEDPEFLPCAANETYAMMVEYDPNYGDPEDEENHWVEYSLPFDNARSLYHIQPVEDANFYVYLDREGWLHLYDDGDSVDYPITDKLSHVYAVRYLAE